MSDELFGPDGGINLARPTLEQLREAAKVVFGDKMEDVDIGKRGTRLFFGPIDDLFCLREKHEELGTPLEDASDEAQDELMAEARQVRRMREEAERTKAGDPAFNPMVKLD